MMTASRPSNRPASWRNTRTGAAARCTSASPKQTGSTRPLAVVNSKKPRAHTPRRSVHGLFTSGRAEEVAQLHDYKHQEQGVQQSERRCRHDTRHVLGCGEGMEWLTKNDQRRYPRREMPKRR